MRREKFTEKLVRMIETIESGSLPAKVLEFYVFGSYSRGALEPDDLDLLVVHSDPGQAYWNKLKAEGVYLFKARRHLEVEMRGTLRRPGERVEIGFNLGDEFAQEKKAILLWSCDDRNWRPKLDAIRPDPDAGSFQRDHFFPLRRLNTNLTTMEEVTAMIRDGQLLLTRTPMNSITLNLSHYHQERLDHLHHLHEIKMCGRELLKIAPYVFQWFQSHRRKLSHLDRIVHEEKRNAAYWAAVGRPTLNEMLYYLKKNTCIKRYCLIPYLKKAGPNELLVFERGPKWQDTTTH